MLPTLRPAISTLLETFFDDAIKLASVLSRRTPRIPRTAREDSVHGVALDATVDAVLKMAR